MSNSTPILTAHLFPKVTGELHRLIESLTADEWNARQADGRWAVRDIAAHLLDGSLRRLSAHRDRHVAHDARTEFAGYDDLLRYLNQLNADWIAASRRLSPRVVLDLLRDADGRLAAFFAQEDPEAPALWPVAWAGEASSKNWFDIARDYTEKWHHTQQIFEIAKRPSTIVTCELMCPVLETFLRALPHAFRNVDAEPDATVEIAIRGEFSGDWYFVLEAGGWNRVLEPRHSLSASVACTPRTAWKLFTTRATAETALAIYPDLRFAGDPRLCAAVVDVVAIMI